MEAEDLIGSVFPDQIACAENLPGEREIPDHPLVRQTIDDCLNEAMDIDGLERLLQGIESGAVRVVARDLTQPSPLALEVLTARPYAYLDDAPLEERRTQAVMAAAGWRPSRPRTSAASTPRRSRGCAREAWPDAANADELHDALVWLGFLTAGRSARPAADWRGWLDGARARTGACAPDRRRGRRELWIAAERLPHFRAAVAGRSRPSPPSPRRRPMTSEWTRDEALVEIVRGRLEGLGPVTAGRARAPLGAAAPTTSTRRWRRSRPKASPCAAASRRTPTATNGASAACSRASTATRSSACGPRSSRCRRATSCASCSAGSASRPTRAGEGADALDADRRRSSKASRRRPPPGKARSCRRASTDYDPAWLDEPAWRAMLTGLRLRPRAAGRRRRGRDRCARRRSRCCRAAMPRCGRRAGAAGRCRRGPAPAAQAVVDFIARATAPRSSTRWCSTRPAALAARGGAGRAGGARPRDLRQLRRPARAAGAVRPSASRRRHGAAAAPPPSAMEDAGRWSLVRAPAAADRTVDAGAVEHVARALLRRYGVVFWRLLEREAPWLPPWRELLRVYRRLEARGEIRGGRFVAGFSGEQFALPEAIGMLREIRRRPAVGRTGSSVSGADPLNLVGILTPGPRLAALDRQPRALSRRRAGRDPVGRRDPLRRAARCRDRMVRPQGAGARHGTRRVPRRRVGRSCPTSRRPVPDTGPLSSRA